jgi:pimeloyl-ACP methyl ester carboxylesterase
MTREIPSAQAWFAGGERIGYDPNARAIVQTPGGALRVFLRREGDLAHAVSFLPGFPDGSFGWAKVLPCLPSDADMPKLFLDYVGMGDSDKPKDYAYSTAERTDLVETIWRDFRRPIDDAGSLRLFLACRSRAFAASASTGSAWQTCRRARYTRSFHL